MHLISSLSERPFSDAMPVLISWVRHCSMSVCAADNKPALFLPHLSEASIGVLHYMPFLDDASMIPIPCEQRNIPRRSPDEKRAMKNAGSRIYFTITSIPMIIEWMCFQSRPLWKWASILAACSTLGCVIFHQRWPITNSALVVLVVVGAHWPQSFPLRSSAATINTISRIPPKSSVSPHESLFSIWQMR